MHASPQVHTAQPNPPEALPDQRIHVLRPERTRARAEDREMIASARAALSLLDSKWAVDLVFLLASGIRRHARLYDNVPGISKKMLTASLRSLEAHGLVERRVYAATPVRVEYSLTPLGWKLTEVLMTLHDWAVENAHELQSAQAAECEAAPPLLALSLNATPLRVAS